MESGGLAVPVGSQFRAARSTEAVLKTFSQSVGGTGMTAEGGPLQTRYAAGGVFGAAYALEVALAELVEGVDFAEAGGAVEQFNGCLVIPLGTAAAHEALSLSE